MTEPTGSGEQPRDDEPGGESTPRDTEGAGPVGLEDRTRERGSGAGDDSGAPGANQAKAEPIPSTPGHRDPNARLEPPLLEDMNVGSVDPQAPSHPAASGSAPSVETGAAGPAATAAPAASAGTSHRTPGMQGSTGADEAVDTDVAAGAAAMRPTGSDSESDADFDADPGDAHGVPVASHDAAGGTSEQQDAVRGARTASTPD